MPNYLFNEKKQKVPIALWAPIHSVESQALDQLKNMASLPFVFKHIAAMPDVHMGKGATVGSVIATKNTVLPAAVGVDIGCGMSAVQILVRNPEILMERARDIRLAIESAIPLGPNGNDKIVKSVERWHGWKSWDDLFATKSHTRGEGALKKTAKAQMGSLGGGNHFIELCTDGEGNVWAMLHSGSRNIGKSLAEIHIYNARAEMKELLISLPDPDLAYYVRGTSAYSAYMNDLLWAQEYAFQNRTEMMSRVLQIIGTYTGNHPVITQRVINCHHNFAAMENHYGEELLITRKGAIRARAGEYGIIPGSMGACSYIVQGLGNLESFCSCSHGAGRRMSRGEAKKRYTEEDLIKQTEGVECRKSASVIDEIPAAYKNIDEVMENQKDLVTVVAKLKQFLCVKG